MNKDKSRSQIPMLMLIFVSLMVLFVVSTDQSSAATIEVGPNQTYTTINSGIAAANPNDDIIVHNNPNNYTGTTVVNKNGLKIKAAPGEDVTVQPGAGYGFQITGVSNITIDRFTIIGSTRNGGYGILAQAYSHNCTISNNFIGNINVGISFAGTNNTFINNYINNTATGMTLNNAVPGGAPAALGHFLISNNKIENVNNGILGTGLTNFQISNNNITAIAAPVGTTTGIDVSINSFLANQNNIINNNIIIGANKAISTNTAGIKFQNSGASTLTNHNLQIYSNSLTNYFRGIQITNYRPTGGTTDIYLNRIYNNTIGMSFNGVATSGLINAINNWWGKNTEPTISINSIEPTTAIDIWKSSALGTLNYNPWIVLKVNASPSTINTGQSSTITADLTKNSNNEDTTTLYPGKYVPDGIPVNFATTLGTIGNTSTTNGVAQSTLDGGATPGVADVSAAVDAETVHTTVNVETPTPPVVSSVDPVDGATNVPTNKVITVTFSKPIQAGSSFSNITVRRVSDNASITVNKVISGNTLTLTIPTAWQTGTQYKLFIPQTAITDLSATTLTASFTSFFTTITPPVSPVVSSVDPVDGATNVPTNKVITVTFSKPIQAGSSFSNITVRRVSDNASITVNKVISGNTLTLTIPTAWQTGTQYKLFIPQTAITDLSATTLTASFTSFFTTITPPVSPVVSSVDPVDGATNVPTNKVITVTFNKAIQAGSTYSSITVRRVSDNVAFTVNKVISGNTLTITIPTAWLAGTQYKLYIPKTAITDLSANTLTTAFTSYFTTI